MRRLLTIFPNSGIPSAIRHLPGALAGSPRRGVLVVARAGYDVLDVSTLKIETAVTFASPICRSEPQVVPVDFLVASSDARGPGSTARIAAFRAALGNVGPR